MAKSYLHTTVFPAIIKSTAKGPLDNRQVVESKADLLSIDTFENAAYNGMLVVVESEHRLYLLKDIEHISATDYSGWIELCSLEDAKAGSSEVKIADSAGNYLSVAVSVATDGHKVYTIDKKIVNLEDATSENTGLVDAYDAKSYIDTKVEEEKQERIDDEEVIAQSFVDLDARTTALEELSADYTITVEAIDPSATETGILKKYKISQLGEVKGTIDIPKDLVVKSGSVVRGTWVGDQFTEDPTGEGKALKLIVANQEAPIYINVEDLGHVYTGSTGDNIKVSISDTFVISSSIVSGSTLDNTITKVSGIEAGAQVNKLEGIILDGSEMPITDKKVNINISSIYATKQELIDDELTISKSYNKLDARVKVLEELEPEKNVQSDWNQTDTTKDDYIKNKPYIVKKYLKTVTSGNTITILASEHKCEDYPIVQIYYNNAIVSADVSVDITSNSDVTVSWSSITPTTSNPIKIRIVG